MRGAAKGTSPIWHPSLIWQVAAKGTSGAEGGRHGAAGVTCGDAGGAVRDARGGGACDDEEGGSNQ